MRLGIIDLYINDKDIVKNIDWESFWIHDIHNDNMFLSKLKITKISSVDARYWLVITNIDVDLSKFEISYSFNNGKYKNKLFSGFLYGVDYVSFGGKKFDNIRKIVKRIKIINKIL